MPTRLNRCGARSGRDRKAPFDATDTADAGDSSKSTGRGRYCDRDRAGSATATTAAAQAIARTERTRLT
jgi:hypothetical protein